MRPNSRRRTGSAAFLAAALAFAPHARAGDPQKVTEERVRAALADARTALEKECGAKLDASLGVRFASAAELSRRIVEENLPLVRLRQPDEEHAKSEAQTLGDAASASMFAKYSWTPHELLVAPKTLEDQAAQLATPELTSDTTLRALLVHELVHAWDDAQLGIPRLLGHADSIDAANAAAAVLEGHAQLVARRVCKARGWSAGFDAYTGLIGKIPDSAKQLGEGLMTTLRARSEATLFTYRDGERFVAALDAAGAEAVARAFREPPRDGETILHPEWFLDPKKRPAVLYDPEPALELFIARFPNSVWTAQRQSLQSSQFESGMTSLPKEEAHALAASLRGARQVVLYPTANPAEKIVVLTVFEFGSEKEARTFLDASDRLSKLKDEQMKTGVVRITGSTNSTIQAEGLSGMLHTKQMKNRELAFEVANIDLLRGKVVVETLFSGEPISLDEHVKLAVDLLGAVKLREAK